MPYGFFTVEQWTRPTPASPPQWVPVRHLNMGHNLSDALDSIQTEGTPGFFRIVQTQRMVWAEVIDGRLKLRKWHASKPETLARTAETFDREGGRLTVSLKPPGKKRKT